MRDVFSLIWLALIGLFRSRASLEVEILTLRHQLNVLRRKSPQRLTFTSIDRLVFAGLYRLAPLGRSNPRCCAKAPTRNTGMKKKGVLLPSSPRYVRETR